MKMQKTNIVCIVLLALVMIIGGCSTKKKSGVEKKYAGVRQTVIYDGMDANGKCAAG